MTSNLSCQLANQKQSHDIETMINKITCINILSEHKIFTVTELANLDVYSTAKLASTSKLLHSMLATIPTGNGKSHATNNPPCHGISYEPTLANTK